MTVTAVAVQHGGYFLPSKLRHLRLKVTNQAAGILSPPPLHISTNPADVNPGHLRDLYGLCNYSCHRFPSFDSNGRVEPVDISKLCTALIHSPVVVSVFTRPEFSSNYSSTTEASKSLGIGGEWIWRAMPITPANGQLVGFGRAISDLELTATIYDVMVTPSLRGRGIGRRIVQRIVRMLTNKGVNDISALCSEKDRPFFQACGFGDDILCSTTMMYTRTASSFPQGDQMIISAGSKLRGSFVPQRECIVDPPFIFWPFVLLYKFGLYLRYLSTCNGLLSHSWEKVCLISARGLRRSSALWKLQWFAVGWIDPNNKYCTKIDTSGNGNPVWKTKFSILVDSSETNFEDMSLHLEVYSRDPIFLREKLLGTATIMLKEFQDKYLKNSEVPKPVEEVGSFQLRKKNSNKPQGFVDISIRISEEREEPSSQRGDHEGFMLMDPNNGINLDSEYGPPRANLSQLPQAPHQQPGSHLQVPNSYTHPMPLPKNYSNLPTNGPSYPSAGRPNYSVGVGGGTSYQPPRTPPPPPSNAGYVPTFMPRTGNVPPTYVNIPSSGAAPRQGTGPGFGIGVGAGALAAGAVIFSDDFMSGFDFPSRLQDPSLIISTDPPF